MEQKDTLEFINSIFSIYLADLLWLLNILSTHIYPAYLVCDTGFGDSWKLTCSLSWQSTSSSFFQEITVQPALWNKWESRQGPGLDGPVIGGPRTKLW